MSVGRKEIEYIASLAKLKLNEDEIKSYTEDLSQILDYINKLNELNTDNVEPLSYPIELSNVLREDILRESLDRELALKNAPRADEQFFKTPKVIKQG